VEVFSGLDLEVGPGERVAITGESGTGKSTLLHLLGLIDVPTEGRIWLGGREATGLGEDQLAVLRNREIGFVWQMYTLLPEFTALENVMMPLLIRGATRVEARRPAEARLEEVGLGRRGGHRAGELSGGEQQRVALARALVGGPAYLLADEPTGNLDSRTGGMIMDLLEAVHGANSLTTIYVTHNPEFAARAGRVLEMRNGRLGERPRNQE
jgi:lipoprotein-releasing system ATP-binding protein